MKLRIPKILLRETLTMALDNVRSNKFRSFLTVLGIVIGVTAAIVVASILTGMRQSIVSIIEEYGTNNIYAFHLTTGPRTSTDRAERLRKPLTVADADTIKAQAGAVEEIAVTAPNVGYNGGPFDDNISYQGRTSHRVFAVSVGCNGVAAKTRWLVRPQAARAFVDRVEDRRTHSVDRSQPGGSNSEENWEVRVSRRYSDKNQSIDFQPRNDLRFQS